MSTHPTPTPEQTAASVAAASFAALVDKLDYLSPSDIEQVRLAYRFADQAHLSRATKRITGFAPAEFARRFVEDESFWVYRLWV